MKIFNFFAHVFATFAFLTLGSLMIIVAMHLLSVEHAVFKLREIYGSPWRSVQTGLIGFFFITVGLAFAKMLVKKGRDTDAIILDTEVGPILVSVSAIEDVVKKVLKRYHLIKTGKIKTLIHGKDVEIKLRLILWSSGRIQELVAEVQNDVVAKVRKLLRNETRLEVTCDVQRIEDHEASIPSADNNHAALV